MHLPLVLRASNTVWRWRASALLMLASGFAGLGYQVVWIQQCALWLGHESAAVMAVVAAFFGGLAAGSLLSGSRVDSSTQPVRWYAAAELVIAAWSLTLTFLMQPFSTWMLHMIGAQATPLWQWCISFTGVFLLLVPATAAMGVTLPAMARITLEVQVEQRSIAMLYASNTLGAVIGVLAIAFWLAPAFGFVLTATLCSLLNAVCGVAALFLFPQTTSPPMSVTREQSGQQLLGQFALTGLLGIGYEVLVVRVLSQVAEDTVYTFAMLLAVYLVGTALGAAMYQQHWIRKRHHDQALTAQLYCWLAAACLAGTVSLWAADFIKRSALHWLGSSMSAAIGAEAIVALTVFGPATVVMGLLFSHLSARALSLELSVGRVLGCNTLGAALAPMLFGVVIFPALGAKFSLLMICVGYLCLALLKSWSRPAWIVAALTAATAIWMPRLMFVDVPDGGRIINYQEGVMAAVSVVEDAEGVSRLRIDNRQQEGSSATQRVDGRQAWLPLLLHPHPQRALFLGLGTGMTALSATYDPTLQVDAVELLPEVIQASNWFIQPLSSASRAARLHVTAADARRYVRTTSLMYDLIVADNFHPARSGSGSLYTVEHFTAVRARLNEGGVFCQWLPLHQLDLPTLRSIVQSFMRVYPNGWAMLASNSLETPVLGLIGRADAQHFDMHALRTHLAARTALEVLQASNIDDDLSLMGNFIAGPTALRRFAGEAPANTDDHPVVAYLAPRITYAPDSLPRERLISLLKQLSITPDELLNDTHDEQWSNRLSAYWLARNRYLELGADIQLSSDVHAMLRQLQKPLLSVLRISPDFSPAREPLLRMADVLERNDVAAAASLRSELQKIKPF